MSHNGVASIHNAGVVPALVEQSHIQPKYGRIEDVPVNGALVGADDHHVLFINLQGLIPL